MDPVERLYVPTVRRYGERWAAAVDVIDQWDNGAETGSTRYVLNKWGLPACFATAAEAQAHANASV